MGFIKESVDQTPINDNVFAVAIKAKEAKEKIGEENVVDATIGSLYSEDGNLVALDTVYSSMERMDRKVQAAYAASFTGNADFCQKVKEWVLMGNSHLYKEVIATTGGTGAVGISLSETLEANQSVVLPEIAWGCYSLLAQMHHLQIENYTLFDGDAFHIDSLKQACKRCMAQQDKIVIVINDPCHNPTGYSMTKAEWKEIVGFLNECSKTHSVVLINDIAYIDYAYRNEKVKEYFSVFDDISENMIVLIAFSLSKSMTSYGMRCGASIILGKTKENVRQVKTVFEKEARIRWSTVNNGAMNMFVDVLDNHADEYQKEKQFYVDLLKERSSIFLQEAAQVGLKHYPYKEGFFITLSVENELRDKFHEAMMKENIFTIKVNKGIRVAICSLPINKCRGLASRMKTILDSLESV